METNFHQNVLLIFWHVIQADGRNSNFEGRCGWFSPVSREGISRVVSKEANRISLLHQR